MSLWHVILPTSFGKSISIPGELLLKIIRYAESSALSAAFRYHKIRLDYPSDVVIGNCSHHIEDFFKHFSHYAWSIFFFAFATIGQVFVIYTYIYEFHYRNISLLTVGKFVRFDCCTKKPPWQSLHLRILLSIFFNAYFFKHSLCYIAVPLCCQQNVADQGQSKNCLQLKRALAVNSPLAVKESILSAGGPVWSILLFFAQMCLVFLVPKKIALKFCQ